MWTWASGECPARFVDQGVWETMLLADMAREGCWPVAGGLLDQTRWFIDFCRLSWGEQDAILARHRLGRKGR